jgi:alpha-beta hydrolase superfamily lysophospholipase
LWTAGIAPTYAPDVRLDGVAALAPVSDVAALVTGANDSFFTSLVSSFVISAYSRAYPDVRFDDYVRPEVRWLAHDMAGRCLKLASVLEATQIDSSIFAVDPNSGPLGARFRENTPRNPITVPLLIAQGETDDTVLPALQEAFVRARCDAGQVVDYRRYAGIDHLGLVASDSPLIPDLLSWTRDRFAGVPAVPSCTTTSR